MIARVRGTVPVLVPLLPVIEQDPTRVWAHVALIALVLAMLVSLENPKR